MRKISTYLRVCGMRRSGNHAVIDWLISQFSGRICFRNNLPNLRALRGSKENDSNALALPGKTSVSLDSPKDKTLVVTSFEDKDVVKVFDPWRVANYSYILDHKVGRFFHVLVLRDPFNMLASRLQKEAAGDWRRYRYRSTDADTRQIVLGMWKSYAKEFIRMEAADDPRLIPINYNRWIFDFEYRNTLCEKIVGTSEVESQLEKIPGAGGGSSFTGRNYVSKEEFLNRWLLYRDHAGMRDIKDDKEMVGLVSEIFGSVVV